MTAYERTGQRDLKLNNRHRLYGYNCPMQDLDFPVIEYDRCEVVALIEYKLKYAVVDPKSANIRALKNHANRCDLPFFVVFYDNEVWWYMVYPVNHIAKTILPDATMMSEREYVSFLYRLRDRDPDRYIKNIELNVSTDPNFCPTFV